MGKKTRKTTWRNLPIEGGSDHQQSPVTISDSEESHITINSGHSTSTSHQRCKGTSPLPRGNGTTLYTQRYSRYDRMSSSSIKYNNGDQSRVGQGSPGSYRFDRRGERRFGSASAAGHRGGGGSDVCDNDSKQKITFNEDEYTRITTPRQDVLFKKGYLNRPRPPPLTVSSATSTADGSGIDLATPDSLLTTPDHMIMTPDNPFSCYPATGYIARDGLYFFNGFEPYPVVVYNAAPPQYCYGTTTYSARSKRYSTDSMTESTTSPHTEEHSGGDGEAPLFLPPPQSCTTGSPHRNVNNQQETIESTALDGSTEQRKLKKKRRRKLSKPINTKLGESTTTSVSVSEDSSVTDTEKEDEEVEKSITIKDSVEDSPSSTCPNSPQSGSSSSSSSSITTSTAEDMDHHSSQLKPDAKEFVPRHYYQHTTDFVQIIDPTLAQFIQPFMPLPILFSPVGPPHHYLTLTQTQQPPPPYNTLNHAQEGPIDAAATDDDDDDDVAEVVNQEEVQVEQVSVETTVVKSQQQQQNNLSSQDIKEIVSKLEEAAKEQEQVVKTQQHGNGRRFNQKDVKQFPQRQRFNKSVINEASPTATSPLRKTPQRKPYTNLFKSNIVNKIKAPPQQTTFNIKSPPQINSSPKINKASSVNKLNQWISVSNRKKRRSYTNNSFEEDQNDELVLTNDKDNSSLELDRLNLQEEIKVIVDDEFEQYDVDKLVDVVVEPTLQQVIEEEVVQVEDVKEVKDVDLTTKSKSNKRINKKQIKRVIVTDIIKPAIVIKESAIIKKEAPKKVVVVEEIKPPQEKKENDPPSTPKSKSKKKSTLIKPVQVEVEVKVSSKKDTSYNFLPTNGADKTNVEVSQELDMFIQKGMYSSLEEKIRSFDITASNDGFFKAINYSGNTSGNKDFNSILKDLTPVLNHNNINLPKDVSQLMTKQSANYSNYGYQHFLGLGPDPHEPDKDNTTPPTLSSDVEQQQITSRESTPNDSYPITRAVKEWMTKAREHTPEVEILKSPTTILKQFTASLGSSEVDELEEEITLWTLSNQDSVEAEQDLLDCWENETADNANKIDVQQLTDDSSRVGQGKQTVDNDDEDIAIEVYKNGNFVRIREEWEQRGKVGKEGSTSNRRHHQLPSATASLPYRAICCAIM